MLIRSFSKCLAVFTVVALFGAVAVAAVNSGTATAKAKKSKSKKSLCSKKRFKGIKFKTVKRTDRVEVLLGKKSIPKDKDGWSYKNIYLYGCRKGASKPASHIKHTQTQKVAKQTKNPAT